MTFLALFEAITLSVLAIGYLTVDTYGSGLRIAAIAIAEWIFYGVLTWRLRQQSHNQSEDSEPIEGIYDLDIDDIIDERDRARIGDESNHAVYTKQLIEHVQAAIEPPECSGKGGNHGPTLHHKGANIS